MFGSQIHALPEINISRKTHKIESMVYTFSIPCLTAPTVSESLVRCSNDQYSSIPLSWQTDVFCTGRHLLEVINK